MSIASATITFKSQIEKQNPTARFNNLANRDSLRWSLLGDQLVSNHGIAKTCHHTGVLGQVHTSLIKKKRFLPLMQCCILSP